MIAQFANVQYQGTFVKTLDETISNSSEEANIVAIDNTYLRSEVGSIL